MFPDKYTPARFFLNDKVESPNIEPYDYPLSQAKVLLCSSYLTKFISKLE